MKKTTIAYLMIFMVTFCTAFALFGQNDSGIPPPDTVIVDPGPAPDPSDATTLEVVKAFFSTVPSLMFLGTIVVGWFLMLLSKINIVPNSTWKQIMSILIIIGLAQLGTWKGFGLFEYTSFWEATGIGLGIALVANKYYDAGTLQKLLVFFYAAKGEHR